MPLNSLNYTKCAAIVHGKSEFCLVRFIYTNLHLPVKIISENNGKSSIQINGLKGFLNKEVFQSKSVFANEYSVEYDRKRKKLKNFKLFIIMDTDDCSEKMKEEYITGSLFRDHPLKEYIVPIYNISNLEDVMMRAGIMVDRISDSEKGTYYNKVFPINTEPVSIDTIKQIQKVGGKVGTLTVELSVQEAEVTSTEIPIKVESVKKKDGTTVENGLTYEYKCEVLDTEEIIEKSKDEYEMFTKTVDIDSLGTTEAVKVKKQDETEYTFKELDKETCYKITVTVTDGEGNTGTESVGILGFKISDGGTGLGDNFYRATLGSDVKSWASSKYSVKVYDGLNLIVRAYGLVVDDGANWVRIGNDEAAFEFYGVVCLLDRATFSEEEK